MDVGLYSVVGPVMDKLNPEKVLNGRIWMDEWLTAVMILLNWLFSVKCFVNRDKESVKTLQASALWV